MQITSAQFLRGITGTNEILEDPIPQVAFVGRSNVGKSSVLNSLLGKKDLVKTSSTPGKTKEINFFGVETSESGKNYFVDLPGYGFAKLPEKMRMKLKKLIIWYLTYSGVKPKKVVLIIDAKIGVSNFDEEMLDLLKENKHNIFIIANKADKLNQKELSKQAKAIKDKIGEYEVSFYSAKTKKRREELLKKLIE